MKLTLTPLCLLALSAACGSSEIGTSRTSNWLECTEDSDCAVVDGACSERYCVDGEGNKIVDPGLASDAARSDRDGATLPPGEPNSDGGTSHVVEPPPAQPPPAGDAAAPAQAPVDASAPLLMDASTAPPVDASVEEAAVPPRVDATVPPRVDATVPPVGDAALSPDSGATAPEDAAAQSMPLAPACELEVEVGPCLASVARYAFNRATGICEPFTYGGCQGNANNFETLEQCQKSCPAPASVCGLPAENGPCKGSIPRFAFDPETGKCGEFTYGGCGGNGNNFTTEKECINHCSTPAAQCALPVSIGPCKGAFKRYFYSAGSGQCYEFTYGGCEGNANNFETAESCEGTCGPFRRDACLPEDTAVPSAANCLQDDAACYQIAGGGYCTGPRAALSL